MDMLESHPEVLAKSVLESKTKFDQIMRLLKDSSESYGADRLLTAIDLHSVQLLCFTL